MNRVTYHLLEHDGGWAYRVDGSISETFHTREIAHAAALRAAAEQRRPGEDTEIVYEDETGHWTQAASGGDDRPATAVDD